MLEAVEFGAYLRGFETHRSGGDVRVLDAGSEPTYEGLKLHYLTQCCEVGDVRSLPTRV